MAPGSQDLTRNSINELLGAQVPPQVVWRVMNDEAEAMIPSPGLW